MSKRLVVLVSGGGTNLQAILDACAGGELAGEVEVVAVVSNRVEAYGLERARLVGVPAVSLPVDGRERKTYDEALADSVAQFQPDLVILAGWMRIVTMAFVGRFPVINLHPALPGAFAGLGAIERAFAAWENGTIRESGVMVHWVPDEGVDVGPVITKETVPFQVGDSIEQFEDRLHTVEHRLVVEAIPLALASTHEQSSR